MFRVSSRCTLLSQFLAKKNLGTQLPQNSLDAKNLCTLRIAVFCYRYIKKENDRKLLANYLARERQTATICCTIPSATSMEDTK
jgi:hypothetical protein